MNIDLHFGPLLLYVLLDKHWPFVTSNNDDDITGAVLRNDLYPRDTTLSKRFGC